MTRRQIALVLILIVDVGYIAWGGGAAASPEHLLGPGGKGILPAAYEGYAGGSWSQLASASPLIAGYMRVLYRMYGVYCLLFGLMGSAIAVTAFRRGERWAWWTLLVGNTVALVSAITMDKLVNAIGPFEVTEYVGLLLVWGAFAITAPVRAAEQPVPAGSFARSR
jgi:hypothetical protein